MLGDNRRPYILKQTYTFQQQVCLRMRDLPLPPGIRQLSVKGINALELVLGPCCFSTTLKNHCRE